MALPQDKSVVLGGIGAVSFTVLRKQLEAMNDSSFSEVTRALDFQKWFEGCIDPHLHYYREALQI